MSKPINGAMRRKVARYQRNFVRSLNFPRIEIDEYLDWVDGLEWADSGNEVSPLWYSINGSGYQPLPLQEDDK